VLICLRALVQKQIKTNTKSPWTRPDNLGIGRAPDTPLFLNTFTPSKESSDRDHDQTNTNMCQVALTRLLPSLLYDVVSRMRGRSKKCITPFPLCSL